VLLYNRVLSDASSQPLVTVFTCTVYFDIARIWYACVSRIFPADEAKFEIFLDSDADIPELPYLHGVNVLRQAPSRRDFQEAYNDAVARAETPYLAFIDSDVYWVSDRIWPFIKDELRKPEVGAVSCVTRSHRESHGTFSVVMKSEIYREVLQTVPGGFLPASEFMDLSVPTREWRWFDTGDLVSQGVRNAGYEVKLLQLDRHGEVVMFRNITVFRRPADWVGAAILGVIKGKYFWRGYLGNLALKYVHDRLFDDGPRYQFALRSRLLLTQAMSGGPRQIWWRYQYARRVWKDARKVLRFLSGERPKCIGIKSAPTCPGKIAGQVRLEL
jgi:glycosyltransferase involved in cell wall biosynthesis